MKLFVKRKEDKVVFPVWKYVDGVSFCTVWCKAWEGPHIVGESCDWHLQPAGYQYRESDFPSCNDRHEKLVKDGDSAKCAKCGKWFGWWCQTSPDNDCHYYTTEGVGGEYVVKLANGKTHIMPNYTSKDEEHENEDECLFCGGPEERK